MSLTRRNLLLGSAAAGIGGVVARAGAQDAFQPVVSRGRTKIVVLGSLGGQNITRLAGADACATTSVLVDVDGEVTVVDCGLGSLHRLVEAGYDADRVRNVLITHHHIDHNADLGNVAAFAWTSGHDLSDARRRIDIYGPTGTRAYERGYKRAAAISLSDSGKVWGMKPGFGRFARWHELQPPRRPRTVFSDSRLHVTCVRVNHGSVPAIGFRIRTPDVDIVVSGDRGPRGDAFVQFARGADALLHEIILLDLVRPVVEADHAASGLLRHLENDHCGPEQVGQVASAAGVKTLVLYHLIPGTPLVTDDTWISLVQPHFSGRIVVGRDLRTV
jgi:ribonuclease BN (tRNA processing enzyme)